MTAVEIVEARPISQVFIALGGDPPKRGRARAFWRDGDNPQAISLNDSKGCWYDHRDGIGGGVLDLVQHVRGCDRGTAIQWLAEFTGLPLDDRPMAPAERREYARRRAAAEREAAELLDWQEQILLALRRERTRWWGFQSAARMYVLEQGLEAPLGDVMATLYEVSEDQIEQLNHYVAMLAMATYADLLPTFREQRQRRAA